MDDQETVPDGISGEAVEMFGNGYPYGPGWRSDDPGLPGKECPRPLHKNPPKAWAATCAGRRDNPGFFPEP